MKILIRFGENMKYDFENIIKKLSSRANSIYFDKERVMDLLIKTKKKVEKNPELKSIVSDIKIIAELVKDWWSGKYKELTKNTIILLIVSLIYLINPIDIIPDFLIGGFIDDAAVIAYILKKISTELDAYKLWKDKNDDVIEVNIFEDIE